MYVRKMFQISSLISNGRMDNDDAQQKFSVIFNYRKNPYWSLDTVPKSTIICFYIRSILIGLWVLLKWTFQCLWNTVNKSRRKTDNGGENGDYYGYLHDKPPPCLVDNRIGLQSYVKLRVRTHTKKRVFFSYFLSENNVQNL